jgi:competence protein ComEC
MLFGISIAHQKKQIHWEHHFANLCDSISYYEAIISEEPQEKANHFKIELTVEKVFCENIWKKSKGNILLYIKRSEDKIALLKSLQYGDKLLIAGSPIPTSPPPNPQQFDFQKYLANQQIYHQQFIEVDKFRILGHTSPNWVVELAIQLRKKANLALQNAIHGQAEYAVVSALVLGIKDNLDNAIRSTYSHTGAMHVLAVSGLHVGILFQILTWLLTWIKKNKKYGNWIFLSIVLLCLWFYALLTGLSPSVLRAVIMFSLVALADTIQRNSSIYNTIAISAFLILCYDPYLLFSVSFQLSYTALLAIIYFQPKIFHWWKIEDSFPNMNKWVFKAIKFCWSITCVSLAAQLGTFPIGLFYFHQFPNYFIFSNLVVIPLATFIFSGSLLALLFSWFPFIAEGIGFLVEKVVWLQNEALFFMEHLPYAVIEGIYISLGETLLIYSTILLLAMLFAFQKISYLYYAVACTVLLFISQMQEFFAQKQQTIFYVFHSGKSLNMSFLEGNQNIIFADSSLIYNDYQVRNLFYNYWTYKGVSLEKVKYFNISDLESDCPIPFYKAKEFVLFSYHQKKFLWLWEKREVGLPSADFLLISKNAVRNIEQLDFSKFKTIILDASNSYYNSKKLSSQAKKLGINLYVIYEQGAFTKELINSH